MNGELIMKQITISDEAAAILDVIRKEYSRGNKPAPYTFAVMKLHERSERGKNE